MFGILWSVIIGGIVGLIARAVHPGEDKLSFLWTIALGVGGSFLAKYVGIAVGWYADGQNAGFIASIVGAVVLLIGYSAFKQRQARA